MNETIFAAPEQSTVQIEEIFFSWLLTMVACWTWSAGYEVAESGADLDLVSFASFIFFQLYFHNHEKKNLLNQNLMVLTHSNKYLFPPPQLKHKNLLMMPNHQVPTTN